MESMEDLDLSPLKDNYSTRSPIRDNISTRRNCDSPPPNEEIVKELKDKEHFLPQLQPNDDLEALSPKKPIGAQGTP